MRSVFAVVLPLMLLMPLCASGAALQRVTASHHITAVTVYPDRAMTSRSAAVTLRPGSYVIAFEGLPTLIQDDSVRVEGKGNAGVTIMGLEVKRAFEAQVPEKKVKELDAEILALERKAGGLDAKKASLTSQKGFIDSIKVAWSDRISKELGIGKPTSAELNEAVTFIGNGIVRVEEQTRELDAEKKLLRDRIDALRRQRDQALGSYRKESKTVEVNVEVVREGSLNLDLTSVTPQVSWEPSYDVRLAGDGTSAELTFRALVRQQTGEEWKDVALTLSTARPAIGGAPPELYPWRVAFYRPPPPMPMPMAAPAPAREMLAKKSRMMMAREEAELDMVKSEEPVAAAVMTAQVAEEQNSVTFRIARPVDIPADGTQHGSVVAVEKLPVALEFVTIPKLTPVVFLKSEIVNQAAYPLLPGRVNIFSGNTFNGSSTLKKVAAGEKFDLFFGADDQVTVKRHELKSHKEAGLFGKNRMGYRYRIELQNFRKQPQTVTVKDQLPLAGDDEIKVTLDDPSVTPDKNEPDGVIVWKLPLKAGEKRELTFGIAVEYPKDKEVNGL